MSHEVRVDLHWVKKLELTFGAWCGIDWLSSDLLGQVSLVWIQVTLRGVVLVAKARFIIERVVSRLNCVLGGAIHAHCELSLDSLLKGFTLAYEWLCPEHI